jgi:hypothetical protein
LYSALCPKELKACAEIAAYLPSVAAGEINKEGLTFRIRDNWPKP